MELLVDLAQKEKESISGVCQLNKFGQMCRGTFIQWVSECD
ncbi:hypothetical protein MANES_16G112950v8 [Manihot esculenta]|uniref:Uncharacterized protein n=1 Tax=Manihot esculenta TaxID=3983 RepID=A0ACB7G7T7_MANES|nr:hypothetical protein MANES_16G112950v8 [Manihot esculenta]